MASACTATRSAPVPDILLSTAYLPPVDWAAAWAQATGARVHDQEKFEKQSYRNRAVILGPNGVQTLSVPIEKEPKYPAKEWKISFREDWPRVHWKALETAYDNSPFFGIFKNELKSIYQSPPVTLWELNAALWEVLRDLLQLNAPCAVHEPVDLTHTIHPKKPSPVQEFPPYLHHLKHKHAFVPRLSTLDLLAQEGPAATGYLKQLHFVF